MAALAWAKEVRQPRCVPLGNPLATRPGWMAGRALADWAKSNRPAVLRWLPEQEVSDCATCSITDPNPTKAATYRAIQDS